MALGPLSVDMYLPAMPSMREALGTDIARMHLTLTTYLAGYAIFHLACGPLADRFGRRPLLMGGTGLFVLACLGCASADTVEELLVYRFIQGIGACVGPTLARTVARDVFGPTRAARALSIIAMLMALAPAVAPGLGGILLLWLPWPIIFFFLATYGVVMILLIHWLLAETNPVRQSLHPGVIARNYAELIRDPLFLIASLGSSLLYSGMMVYLSSSGFVFIDMLGVPIQYFGLIFLTSVLGYMLGSAISARLTSHYLPEEIVLRGALLCAAAAGAMVVGNALEPQSVLAIVLPKLFFSSGIGLVLPNAMAISLRPFPHIAGTASSLFGFIQMALSASVTAVIGLFLQDTPVPMLYFLFAITIVALLLSLRLHRLRLQPSL